MQLFAGCFSVIFSAMLIAAAVIGWQGWRKIPADPPHRGVPTLFGKRQEGPSIKEGWHFFFLYPFVRGFIAVNVKAKENKMPPIQVRTPDMAPIEIHASYTYSPDPGNLIAYLNFGREEGIQSIMNDVVDEAIRERVIDPNRPPRTWKEAVGMERELLSEVVRNIIGKLPTEPGYEDIKVIEDELRRGNSKLRFEKLGFILNRLNILKVHPQGGLIEAAERLSIERSQMEGEKVEIQNLRRRIKEMKKDLNFSSEQALEAFQTERKKITKTIHESKLNVSNETRDFLANLLHEGFRMITEAIKSGKAEA